jgi:protein TonB
MITSTQRNFYSARHRWAALQGAACLRASVSVAAEVPPRRAFHDGSGERKQFCAFAVVVLTLHGLLALEALRSLESMPAISAPAPLDVQLNLLARPQRPVAAMPAPQPQPQQGVAPPAQLPRPAAAPPRVRRAAQSPVAHRAASPTPVPAAATHEASNITPAPGLLPAVPERDDAAGQTNPQPAQASAGSQAAAGEMTSGPVFNAGYLHNPPPDYPAIAQQRAWQGTVLLKVQVLASGKPSQIEIVSSSGHASLDDAARDAVTSWRFVPARRGGQPVDGWVQVPIEFKLGT